jgi:hypothetical protein
MDYALGILLLIAPLSLWRFWASKRLFLSDGPNRIAAEGARGNARRLGVPRPTCRHGRRAEPRITGPSTARLERCGRAWLIAERVSTCP